MSKPEASIIVPLAGDPAAALRCLQGIAAQEGGPHFEVILVAAPEGRLQQLLASLQGDLKIVPSAQPLQLGEALRRGLEHAESEIAVVVRESAAPQSQWLAPLVCALREERVGVAVSQTLDTPAEAESPLGALAFAARTGDLRAVFQSEVPSALVLGTLALALCKRGLELRRVSESRIAAAAPPSPAARRPPPEAPELAIVVPTLDATSARLRRCVESLHAQTDVANEILILDNGAPPQGFTAPVNAGIRATRAPYVVVMNDDVEVLEGWWQPLHKALVEGASVACPLTVEGGMRHDFPAWCFAFSRKDLELIAHAPGELFDPSLVIWFQDTDLLRRLRQAGRAPVIVESSRIRHGLSRTLSTEDPVLEAWIHAQIASDRERFLAKHPDAQLGAAQLSAA